jgi:signal transduction histidine kinase
MLMPERMKGRHMAGVQRYLETGIRKVRWEALEVVGLHRDGREIPLEISYGVFQKEEKYFFTGIARDVTERKQAEKEKQYKDMLERFNQELESLVAERTMSLIALKLADRVRTPATVIELRGKKMLGRGDIPKVLKPGITAIIEEAEKLESIVKDFQALLKSDRPQFNYEDINEIVRGVVSIVEREAAGKRIELNVRTPDAPLKVNAQKDLLTMAVFNLLRNAIESTSEGGRITVVTAEEGDNVLLSVSDTGHGIPGDILEKIFDPLFSAKIYRFGMGLPLVKQIVSEHLGEITVESEMSRGTTFRLLFPARWMTKASG